MLSLDQISLAYGDKIIFNRFSHTFEDGAVTGIVGASGIGKTTLLNLMAGLLSPTEGKIHSSYLKPAYIFQEPRLFPWMTALENLTVVCHDENKAVSYLEQLIPDDDAKHKYPHELSGGMKQRISIARALSYDADILFLDEPFKGLDTKTKTMTADILFRETQGKTVIMVTHDPKDLTYCKHILSLDPPSLSEEGKNLKQKIE